MRHLIRAALPPCLALATLLTTALVSSSAHAAPDRKSGIRIRLHGDLDFLSFYHINPDGDGDSINGGGFGIGRTSLIDSGSAGTLHPRPVWTLGVGVVLLDERLNVGAKFSFAVDGVQSLADGVSSVTLVSGHFVPYVRWIFLPGQRFRPFVEGHFGLGGGSSRTNAEDGDNSTTGRSIYPLVGLAGGVHIFVIDAFSFDVGLGFDYVAPHTRNVTVLAGDREVTDWNKAADVINLAVTTGISAWF